MGLPSESSALLTALRSLRDRWWLILAGVLAGLAVGLIVSATATKKYTAQSSLLVKPSQLPSLIDPNAQTTVDPQRDASTALKLVTSTAVAARVQLAIKSDRSVGDLLSEIDAAADPDADIITIDATDPDPRFAARLANAFAQQFVAFRTDSDRAAINDGGILLQRRISQLPADSTAERAQLQQQLLNVQTLATVTTGDAQVVDTATQPTSPSVPRTTRNVVIAVIAGVILAIAGAFLADLFDRRVKTVEEFESIYQLPTLTTIPERSADPTSARDRAAALEPFRILLNGLPFISPGDEVRVVLVTSAVPGEGKSTVAAGLARAAAQSGERVILVECDLRRPTFHEQFDLGTRAGGLTSALVKGTPVSDSLRTVLPDLPTLLVLPSGPTPPNAAELLRSSEMTRVLADLRDEADFIVLDAPPLLPVADAQSLLAHAHVDATLIVSRLGKISRPEIERTLALFQRQREAPFGLVVNGAHAREVGGSYDEVG